MNDALENRPALSHLVEPHKSEYLKVLREVRGRTMPKKAKL